MDFSGASNPSDMGLEASAKNISLAYLRALVNAGLLKDDLSHKVDELSPALWQQLAAFPLDGCWCALAGSIFNVFASSSANTLVSAGLDTPEGVTNMRNRLASILTLRGSGRIRCTNDCELLTGCIKDTDKGIAVIAGKCIRRVQSSGA